MHMYMHYIITQTLIAEKAALLNIDDESDLSSVLHRQRRLLSVEREIIALTDRVCIYHLFDMYIMICSETSE